MKIVRHGPFGQERPGLLDAQGAVRDLTGIIPDWTGDQLSPASLDRVRAVDVAGLPLAPADTRLGCPVARVRNVIAIGLNYVKHAEETNNKLPPEPIVFNKHTACLVGARDDIIRPPTSTALDWEVELAVVIGSPAWHVAEADALSHVAGYALANDVSERHWQLERAGQWTKGKSYPSWCPLGPFLLTADDVADPHDIALWLEVNGERRQDGNTDDLNFNVPQIIAAVSELMALLPGDVIVTGTPSGVGQAFTPPIYLQPGDEVVVGSSILGEQSCRVVDHDPATAAAFLAKVAGQWR